MPALFYHLTRSRPEALIPLIVRKAREAGWPVEVRGASRDRIEALDTALWGQGGEFLPHGLAGGPHDARQPVLLTVAGQAAENAPRCLLALDGVEVGTDEALVLERACILFDGHDEAAVQRARAQWKALTGAGVAAEYWSEADGRWQKKA